jgi:hypothetical protein
MRKSHHPKLNKIVTRVPMLSIIAIMPKSSGIRNHARIILLKKLKN